MSAGTSAERTARDIARLRRRRWGVVAVVAVVAAAAVWWWAGPVPAAVAAAAVTLAAPAPKATRSWRIGAQGERDTARLLRPLRLLGWRTLHDRRVPGQSGNIDHLVVGRGGVFAVETKSWSGTVTVDEAGWRVDGRRADKYLDEVRREADAARRALVRGGVELDVEPVICVHRAELPSAEFLVDGVTVVAASRLRRLLHGQPSRLRPATVRAAAAVLDEQLPPA